MKLIAKTRIDHHIQIEERDGRIDVRLTDDSGGTGEMLDVSGVIREMNESSGIYLAPLKSGGSTPCSPAQIAWILDHVEMTVEKVDHWTDDEETRWISIPHLYLPKDLEQRTRLLAADWDDVKEIERVLDDDVRWTPPEWFKTLEALRADPSPTLFSAR